METNITIKKIEDYTEAEKFLMDLTRSLREEFNEEKYPGKITKDDANLIVQSSVNAFGFNDVTELEDTLKKIKEMGMY